MNKALDAITDKVLAYRPSATPPLKVIAGAPDTPLRIGDIEIPCYVLENEIRVLSQSGMFKALGLARRGLVPSKGGAQIPRFAASKAINPFISNELQAGLSTPIIFTANAGPTYGYPATILVDICNVVLQARQARSLNYQQQRLAERCEILLRGFAYVGIIALVDEATGYQRIREKRDLATFLERFITAELQPWTRTFPYTFYEQIFRLKGWGNAEGMPRPSVVGHYTNDFVYERIAPGVLDELRSRNPVLPQGWRRNRHHQWFTPEYGHPRLKQHLEGVTALMRAARSWDGFKRSLDRVYPKLGTQFPMPVDEDDQ